MRGWIAPIAGGLAAAALGFWLVLNWVPGFLMGKALDSITTIGPGYNQVFHGPVTDETSRRVVRPSPDILYSVCAYDLSEGNLVLDVPWPTDGSYASVSFYDSDTNNFAVLSDRDFEFGETLEVALGMSEQTPVDGGSRDWITSPVTSPSITGLALYRRVLMGDTPIEIVDAERRAFSCRTASF